MTQHRPRRPVIRLAVGRAALGRAGGLLLTEQAPAVCTEAEIAAVTGLLFLFRTRRGSVLAVLGTMVSFLIRTFRSPHLHRSLL